MKFLFALFSILSLQVAGVGANLYRRQAETDPFMNMIVNTNGTWNLVDYNMNPSDGGDLYVARTISIGSNFNLKNIRFQRNGTKITTGAETFLGVPGITDSSASPMNVKETLNPTEGYLYFVKYDDTQEGSHIRHGMYDGCMIVDSSSNIMFQPGSYDSLRLNNCASFRLTRIHVQANVNFPTSS